MRGLSSWRWFERRAHSATVATLVLVACAAGSGCEEKTDAPTAPGRRADAVTAKSQSPDAGASPTASAARAGSNARTGPLCDATSGKDALDPIEGTAKAAGGTSEPSSRVGFDGTWVWLNFWAAWCKPCLEEMPILQAWEKKLNAEGVDLEVVFVSVDDDERQLDRFLEKQPEGGVKQALWLRDTEGRADVFAALGFESLGQLPLHAIVGPDGKLACRIEGAIQESDEKAVRKLLGAKTDS